jgi:hypothetical protein
MINVAAITVTLFQRGTTMNPNPSLLPTIAGGLFILFGLSVAAKDDRRIQKIWLLPAVLSLSFLIFSIQTIMTEGLFGFWTEHTTRNLWGSQIWLDLLLAVSIGWFLVVPQAKAIGMRPLPWFLLIVCTGCIGFSAMMARLLYLQENASDSNAA